MAEAAAVTVVSVKVDLRKAALSKAAKMAVVSVKLKMAAAAAVVVPKTVEMM